jgi:hypothetical protein
MSAASLLRRAEPRDVREGKEPDVPTRDDEGVGDALEAPDLHREIVEPLGLALFLRPGRPTPARDQVPELKVITGQIIRPLSELKVVAAMRKAAHRDLKRSQAAEGSQEVGAKTEDLVAGGIAPRTAIASTARLRMDRELAVSLVEPLPEALAAHRGGGPDDW